MSDPEDEIVLEAETREGRLLLCAIGHYLAARRRLAAGDGSAAAEVNRWAEHLETLGAPMELVPALVLLGNLPPGEA